MNFFRIAYLSLLMICLSTITHVIYCANMKKEADAQTKSSAAAAASASASASSAAAGANAAPTVSPTTTLRSLGKHVAAGKISQQDVHRALSQQVGIRFAIDSDVPSAVQEQARDFMIRSDLGETIKLPMIPTRFSTDAQKYEKFLKGSNEIVLGTSYCSHNGCTSCITQFKGLNLVVLSREVPLLSELVYKVGVAYDSQKKAAKVIITTCTK